LIASRISAAHGFPIIAALALLCACHTPVPPPLNILEQPGKPPLLAPNAADIATRDIAVAVLRDQPNEAAEPLIALHRFETTLRAQEGESTGLVPWAQYAVDACIPERDAYRTRVKKLLKTKDLDPALRTQLEVDVADDPLALADARMHDAHVERYGSFFNRIAAPIGRSLFSGIFMPISLSHGLTEAIVDDVERDPLSFRERQALVHWKTFLARNPEDAEAPAVAKKVAHYDRLYRATRRKHYLEITEKALEHGQPKRALQYARLLLDFDPRDEQARALFQRAQAAQALDQAWLERSLQAPLGPLDTELQPEIRARSLALLLDQPAPTPSPGRHNPLASEIAFSEASALVATGQEDRAEKVLHKLASVSPKRSTMGRHAAALLDQPKLMPYLAFRDARSRDNWLKTRWLALGPLANGFPDRGMPLGLNEVLGAPLLLNSIATLPTRLLYYPRMKPWPFGRAPALYARLYLERFEQGEHREEVLAWLEKHELRTGNELGALEIARRRQGANTRDLSKLEEGAAKQLLEYAKREKRRDMHMKWLEETASLFPETRSGQEAGKALRQTFVQASPQHIQITRGYFLEHPELAGPRGLALRPELLDNEPSNGELHPQGVTLLGSNVIQVAYLDRDGDPDEPPRNAYERIPEAQFARFVALLDETSLRKAMLDSDYEHTPNANRDRFFEHAKLGLVDQPDFRPAVETQFTFQGVREKYGLVRARESLLPVDLVVQGSLYDMSLGAFPRVRMPKETPDAVLYR